jgi:hypothetical protein
VPAGTANPLCLFTRQPIYFSRLNIRFSLSFYPNSICIGKVGLRLCKEHLGGGAAALSASNHSLRLQPAHKYLNKVRAPKLLQLSALFFSFFTAATDESA